MSFMRSRYRRCSNVGVERVPERPGSLRFWGGALSSGRARSERSCASGSLSALRASDHSDGMRQAITRAARESFLERAEELTPLIAVDTDEGRYLLSTFDRHITHSLLVKSSRRDHVQRTANRIERIAALWSEDVWAVGEDGRSDAPLIERWNGRGFTRSRLPFPSSPQPPFSGKGEFRTRPPPPRAQPSG